MARLIKYDGGLLLQGGSLASTASSEGDPDPECCCEAPCICPEGCIEGLEISLGGTPACAGGLYSDFIPCTGGGISASMYCENGVWYVSVSVCCFENGGECFYLYSAEFGCEEDGLPPAGPVVLTEISGLNNGGCPPLPPSVTINK